MNVGAKKPYDYGLYFQWGDTKGYTTSQVGKDKQFSLSDYKWYLSGSEEEGNIKFGKYTTTGATLDLEDDAAHANMGGDWHMPTYSQLIELTANTTNKSVTQNGVNGRLFVSKSDSSKSIFIPTAGGIGDGSAEESGNAGFVWANMVNEGNAIDVDVLTFYSKGSNDPLIYSMPRYIGLSVRGVIDGTYVADGAINDHDYVDLGLPSGTLWATMNVGASKPSDAGLYFQWGDTSGYTAAQVGKDKQFTTDWSDYKWRLSGNSDDNVAFKKYTTTGATLDLEDDAAHIHMGGSWHMPSPEQIQELIANTISTNTRYTYLLTSNKDSSKRIFFPKAGNAYDGNIYARDLCVWSSMISNDYAINADIIGIDIESNPSNENAIRYEGLSVRGVIG